MDIKPQRIDKFHEEYIKKFADKDFPVFSNIEFNLHGSCNRRCAFCPRVDESIWPNLDEELSIDLFNKIIKELKEINYSGRLSFSGFSEPFLHSKLSLLVKTINTNLPDAKAEIITNGDLLTVDNAKELYGVGLKYLYVSLYTNKKTYDYLLGIQEKLNLDEDQFQIRPRNLGRKMNFGLNINNRAGAVDYTRFGLKQEKKLPLKQPCYYPMYTIFVDYNGDCLICPDDWEKRKIIGNAKKENILQIFLKNTFHEVRKRLLKGNRSEIPCEKCDVNGLLNGKEHASKWKTYYKKNL